MTIPAAALFAGSSALSMMQGAVGRSRAIAQADVQNEMVRRTNELNRKNALRANRSSQTIKALLFAEPNITVPISS